MGREFLLSEQMRLFNENKSDSTYKEYAKCGFL